MAATVLVVDDDEAVRDSLRFMLEQEGLVVRTFDSAAAVLCAELPVCGCLLTDFHMPAMDGLQLQGQLAAQGNRLPVIIMTGHGDVPVAVRAMKAGAVDFLEKPFEQAHLLDAIHRALASNQKAVEAAAGVARAAGRLALLTPREQEVLDILVAGRSTKEIARILGTSPRTIDVHRARLFQKLQADTLPELVHLVLAARPDGPLR
jgi:two-component system, LuxR family, response regulator FixJ